MEAQKEEEDILVLHDLIRDYNHKMTDHYYIYC